MGTQTSKNISSVNCDAACRKERKKIELYNSMNINRWLSTIFNKVYENSRSKYNTFIHGPGWIRKKHLREEATVLQTKHNRVFREYDTEFKWIKRKY